LVFEDNSSVVALSSGAYIPIGSGATKSINFLVSEYIQISDLGIYMSPSLEQLSIAVGLGTYPKPKRFPIGTFIWIIIALIIITFAAYIALQEWYKRRYEVYLFRSKDDLYNLINFFSNSRKAGVSVEETINKLKKSGWKGEQIDYAIKKLEGKRTGMYEIPIFRFFEQRKLGEEMKKRQQSTTANQQKS